MESCPGPRGSALTATSSPRTPRVSVPPLRAVRAEAPRRGSYYGAGWCAWFNIWVMGPIASQNMPGTSCNPADSPRSDRCALGA